MCERLVDEFETSFSRCAGRREATAAEEVEARAWARDGKGADEDEGRREEESVDEEEGEDGEEGAKDRKRPSTTHQCKIADSGYSLRIGGRLEQMSLIPDHLRHECENAVIRAVVHSIQKGFSAEIIDLEPLQIHLGMHSDFAIGLCRCMASRLEEMEAFWDYQLGSDNKQKQDYNGMHGSKEEEASPGPIAGIANQRHNTGDTIFLTSDLTKKGQISHLLLVFAATLHSDLIG